MCGMHDAPGNAREPNERESIEEVPALAGLSIAIFCPAFVGLQLSARKEPFIKRIDVGGVGG